MVGAVVVAVLGGGRSLAECDSIDLVEIAERVEARLRPDHPALALDDDALGRCRDLGDLVRLVEDSIGSA